MDFDLEDATLDELRDVLNDPYVLALLSLALLEAPLSSYFTDESSQSSAEVFVWQLRLSIKAAVNQVCFKKKFRWEFVSPL